MALFSLFSLPAIVYLRKLTFHDLNLNAHFEGQRFALCDKMTFVGSPARPRPARRIAEVSRLKHAQSKTVAKHCSPKKSQIGGAGLGLPLGLSTFCSKESIADSQEILSLIF